MGRILWPSTQMTHSDDMEKGQLNICFASLLFLVQKRVKQTGREVFQEARKEYFSSPRLSGGCEAASSFWIFIFFPVLGKNCVHWGPFSSLDFCGLEGFPCPSFVPGYFGALCVFKKAGYVTAFSLIDASIVPGKESTLNKYLLMNEWMWFSWTMSFVTNIIWPRGLLLEAPNRDSIFRSLEWG